MINNLQLCPNKNSHIVNNITLKFYLKLILINYLLLKNATHENPKKTIF